MKPRGNIEAWRYVRNHFGDSLYTTLAGANAYTRSSAIDDLGKDAPDRARSKAWTYARDPKVRDAVLARAKGKCELCGKLGFIMKNGFAYLESHHIIYLAKQGKDRLTNVIALCPNDHRQAHYGKRARAIEKEMIRKLKFLDVNFGS